MRKQRPNYKKFVENMDPHEKKSVQRKLKKRMKKSIKARDTRMYERYLTINLVFECLSMDEISRVTGRCSHTIYTYINKFLDGGLDGLGIIYPRGRPPFLTDDQKQKVLDVVSNKTPESVGFPAELNWTSSLVREWIKNEWDIEYSNQGVLNLMHSLNLSYTRPTYVLAKADPTKQKEFNLKFKILEERLSNGEIRYILFLDEAMIRDYQAIGRTWFPKGQQKIIPTHGKHQGVKLIGTLNYGTGELFVHEKETYKATDFLSFLHSLLEKYPVGKIALILDNAKIHHAKLIQPFLDENKDRIEFHFLPPYSPNLNCIEQFWGWLKKSCINNVFFSSIDQIRSTVQTFVKKVNGTPEKVIARLCNFSQLRV